MKKISIWAKDHKWSARFLIIASFIVLNALAILTGVLLSSIGISVPLTVMLLFAGAYCAAFIVYPSRSLRRKKLTAAKFYVRQKGCDLILAGSTFFMIVNMANHPDRLFQYGPAINAAVASNSSLPGDSAVKTYKSIAAFTASIKDEKGNLLKWKERKKLLKEQVKAIKNDEPSKGGKITLIILSVLVAIGLISLIAALACSLSCGGSDVAAVIVGLGGTALVIWLLINMIRNINGKKKKKIKEPEKVPMGS